MSETHPAIPPRDSRTITLRNGLLGSYTFNLRAEYDCHFPHSIAVYDPPDAWRPVIAAYYEVEWRRRAERWNALSIHYNRFPNETAESEERHYRYIAKCTYALRTALAWRTWGKPKALEESNGS